MIFEKKLFHLHEVVSHKLSAFKPISYCYNFHQEAYLEYVVMAHLPSCLKNHYSAVIMVVIVIQFSSSDELFR